jgi:hypothetical protein
MACLDAHLYEIEYNNKRQTTDIINQILTQK